MEEELETINKTGQAKNAFNINCAVYRNPEPVLFTGKQYSHRRLHNLLIAHDVSVAQAQLVYGWNFAARHYDTVAYLRLTWFPTTERYSTDTHSPLIAQ